MANMNAETKFHVRKRSNPQNRIENNQMAELKDISEITNLQMLWAE